MRGQRPVVTVVAGIVRRQQDGRLLVSRRPANTHLGGLWEFPGGKVEPGESLETALRRELREEVGADVSVEGLLLEETHDYPDRVVHLHFYDCTLETGNPEALDVSEVAWCTPAELQSYTMPDANARVIQLLQWGSPRL